MTTQPLSEDEFRHTGAVEQDRPEQKTNTSLRGQMPHRDKPASADTFDTDLPEPGENVEHTGELLAKSEEEKKPEEINPEAEDQDMDPGQRQKQNQNDIEEDPLAA